MRFFASGLCSEPETESGLYGSGRPLCLVRMWRGLCRWRFGYVDVWWCWIGIAVYCDSVCFELCCAQVFCLTDFVRSWLFCRFCCAIFRFFSPLTCVFAGSFYSDMFGLGFVKGLQKICILDWDVKACSWIHVVDEEHVTGCFGLDRTHFGYGQN